MAIIRLLATGYIYDFTSTFLKHVFESQIYLVIRQEEVLSIKVGLGKHLPSLDADYGHKVGCLT